MSNKNIGKTQIMYVLMAILVVSLILPFGTTAVHAVASSGATATVTPNAIGAGNAILITTSANAFTGKSVNVYISNNSLATISGATLIASGLTLTSGALTNANVTVPSNTAPGVYYIKLTDDNGLTVVVSNPIQIIAPPYAPTLNVIDYTLYTNYNELVNYGFPGDTIRVCGTNFVPNAPVTIDFIGPTGTIERTTTTTASAQGVCTSTGLTVPSLGSGNYLVLAYTNPAVSGVSGYKVSPVSTGASATFTIAPELIPDLAQYAPTFTGSGFPPGYNAYSIRANQAGDVLKFYGFGLPDGQLSSKNIEIFNSAGQMVATGITQQVNVVKGEFTGPYTVYPNDTALGPIAVNVTILQPLSPGIGYYAVFDISGVNVQSLPFLVSVPSQYFQANFTPTSVSGEVQQLTVQAVGLAAKNTVEGYVQQSILNINYLYGSTTADENGAAYFFIEPSVQAGLPNGTYPVILKDTQGGSLGYAQTSIGNLVASPSFVLQTFQSTNSNNLGKPFGYVGDNVSLSALLGLGGSFPSSFQATSVTFTSMQTGYSVTVYNAVLQNGKTEPISKGDFGVNGEGFFPYNNTNPSLGQQENLVVTVPALPGGEVSVTINGEMYVKNLVPVSVSLPGGTFWVLTSIHSIYWANPMANEWQKLPSGGTYPGDIIDVLLAGFPVNDTGSISFTASHDFSYSELGIPLMPSKVMPNGTLELVMEVPFLPASSNSNFGPYLLSINGAFAATSALCGLLTQFEYNYTEASGQSISVATLGQYAPGAQPHVYVDPQDLVPVSQIGAYVPGVFPSTYESGQTLTIFGTGFSGKAKDFIALNETDAMTGKLISQTLLSTVNSTGYGIINTTVTLPNLPSYLLVSGKVGTSSATYDLLNYTIAVYQAKSGLVQVFSNSENTHDLTTQFNITQTLTVVPTSGPVNTSVTLTGTGFADQEYIVVYVQSFTVVPTGVQLDNKDGSFSFNITIPAYAAGPVTIVAKGTSGLTMAQASFTITPQVQKTLTATLTAPSTAYENESVLYTLTVYYNGQPTSVPLSDISGSILEPTGVTVPMSFLSVGTGQYQYIFHVPTIAGTYTATVTVSYSGLTYTTTASFTALPPPPTPPTSPPNTNLSTTLSSIIAAEQALQSGLTSLQQALSALSSQVQTALIDLASSISSLSSALTGINNRLGSAEAYSLGALVIAFIALIVIIYGVFVRRMP